VGEAVNIMNQANAVARPMTLRTEIEVGDKHD
jgi:hypothetical protein